MGPMARVPARGAEDGLVRLDAVRARTRRRPAARMTKQAVPRCENFVVVP